MLRWNYRVVIARLSFLTVQGLAVEQSPLASDSGAIRPIGNTDLGFSCAAHLNNLLAPAF
jgi:hypothetical protein